MKNFTRTLGILALVATMALAAGCVTGTSTSGASETHGLFSGGGAQAAVTEGYAQLATYMVIFNLFDSGYAEYVAAVRSAEDAGQKITVVSTWILIGMKHTAYASSDSRAEGDSAAAPAQPRTAATSPTGSVATPASATKTTTVESSGVFAGNGHRYEVITKKKLNWEKARKDCENRGGHLATITSREEEQFIEGLLETQDKRGYYWLGGFRKGQSPDFQWITGEPYEYANGWVHNDTYKREAWAKPYKKDFWGRMGSYDGLWVVPQNKESWFYICEWDDVAGQ